ncbi:MAG: hypothetical protein ACRD20_08525 [Terriglobales bacterium]
MKRIALIIVVAQLCRVGCAVDAPLTIGGNKIWSGTNRFNNAANFPGGLSGNPPFSDNPTVAGSFSGNTSKKGASSDSEIYVSSNGNDANDGLSLGMAKATLAGAKAACPASFCCIHISAGGVRLAASVTFTTAVILQCSPRATITYSANNKQIIFNGQGSAVFGCGFVGAGAGNAASPPVVSSKSFFVFSHNSISSFGSTGGLGELSIIGGQNIQVIDNIFNQNGDMDVAVLNATTSQVMFSILIAKNIGSDILVSNSGAGASLAAVNIENNNLSNGEASKGNPCISTTSTDANISDLTVASNVCVLSTATPTVAFDIANVTMLDFYGNIYDASGFNSTIQALKLTNINFATVTGNSFTNSGFGSGVLAERLNSSNIAGNTITGLSATGIGYLLTVATDSGVSASNTFTGNTANLPEGSTGTGFSQVCNATSAVCSNNIFTGNSVFNGSIGIGLTNIKGTTSGNYLGPNYLNTATTGVSVGAGVTNASIAPQKFVAVTAPYNDSGTGTDIQNRSYAGTVTLATGTGTFTIPAGGAFSTTETFACNSNDTTTIANPSKAVPASTTTATVTGTGTDVIAVTCSGH